MTEKARDNRQLLSQTFIGGNGKTLVEWTLSELSVLLGHPRFMPSGQDSLNQWLNKARNSRLTLIVTEVFRPACSMEAKAKAKSACRCSPFYCKLARM
jgi:hypothetical protein